MIGQTISHYKILKKLGEGGMGEVYKAEDTTLKRTVAIKFLPSPSSDSSTKKLRFLHEAQAAAILDHPNICTVHEIDEADGMVFIVMAYLEGQSLKERIVEAPLGVIESVHTAIQVAEGLQAAHEKRIVHRDIKSTNIILNAKGQATILDFGLARRHEATEVTRAGSTLGTVPYMSPEQARGEAVDHRTDIWSLGVMMYEMITGRLPFKSEYDEAVIYSILNEQPAPVTALRSGVPMELERIIKKSMQKDRDQRYQHVDEMLTDLKSLRKELEGGLPGLDSTEAGFSSRKKIYLYSGIAVLAVLAIVVRIYFLSPREETIDSIAVLPLEDLSHDPDQEYFADGMTDALIADLAKISTLRVISRTSVMQYKGVRKPLPEIGRDLNVDAIVEGSVLRSGNRVRITAQLIHAGTDKHLWAESYERDLKDILALQRDVGQAIAQEIRITLTPQEKGRMASVRSVDPEVYQLYLKGRYHWNKRTNEGFNKGIEYFQQALDRDPAYPLAYAGLADSYNLLANYGFLAPKEAFPKANAAAMRALRIDSTLAEAHTSLAFAQHHYDWDFADAEKEFRQAIELNPGYATAHQWYAEFLATMGRHDEASREILRARELDPLSLVINSNVGRLSYYARRYDQAIEELRNALELDPNYFWALIHLCMVYTEKGMYAEAMDQYQKAAASNGATTVLAYLYVASGRKKEARKVLDELNRPENREDPFFLAGIHAGLGEKDEAIALLEKAYEERAFFMVFLNVHPWFDSLHSDPRFSSLLERMGLH